MELIGWLVRFYTEILIMMTTKHYDANDIQITIISAVLPKKEI
jgi:hypothetical protein